VFCRTLSSNEKVVSLHMNFGFETEGILRQHVRINDGYEDITIQAITKEPGLRTGQRLRNILE